MSVTGITAEFQALKVPSGESACLHCGADLAEDQEWCLECGAARTLIHRPPDWRIPLAIIGAVVVLVLAGFAIALTNLSATSNGNTHTVRAAATSPKRSASSPAPPAAQRPIGGWPVGLSGWTVILFKSHDRATAAAKARQLAAAGLGVGVLDSNQHPSMTPGFWVVFSGRYPDRARAQVAAVRLKARGNARARARRVARPGGL